jgi:hypothetical protein
MGRIPAAHGSKLLIAGLKSGVHQFDESDVGTH